ncbi:MAG: hypothetical protein QOH91_3580, partial [Mycobacterium sp.]|nr:hypothetical protein [Mycobacterium sp.]
AEGEVDTTFKAFTFPVTADGVPEVMRAWGELDDYVDDMVARRRHTLIGAALRR